MSTRAASEPEVGGHYLAASQPLGNRRTFLRLERLEGGGHFPQEDAPDHVTRTLDAFLAAR